ncbi:hypothetical protein [Bosea beijingensis]|mgnify:CR=1 FL=1
MIDDHLDHVAVSPEYPVYTPDPLKVLPRFLAMILRTPEFMRRPSASSAVGMLRVLRRKRTGAH